MLKKIYGHLRKQVKKKDEHNVLLLRLLLLTIIVGVTYLIFKPQQIRPLKENRNLLVNGNKVKEKIEFRMTTTHLCAAVVDAEVSLRNDDGIELTFLRKQNSFRQFEPLSPPATYTVKSGDCIPAYPACADMNFQYCFTIDTSATPAQVDYIVK